MNCLQDCEEVRQHLKTCKKAQVDALHKYIFESEGDRNNRKRLREFSGFNYDEADPRYANKVTYVYKNLSTADLTAICGVLGLDHNGTDVYERIFKNLSRNTFLVDITQAAQADDEEEEEEEGEVEANINDEDVQEVISNTGTCVSSRASNQSLRSWRRERSPVRVNSRFSFDFRDVENSIRTFDGTGSIPVEIWLEEFNEMAILMGWDQLQKMIFAKRSLKGIAKLYVMGERGLTSWQKLRDALLTEFGRRVDSEQLHEMLRERKMKKDEGLYEYFYTMKDIAAQGVIEESALIQYVIKGIKDIHVNKAILYGATTVKEFKTKLQAYELFTKESKTYHSGDNANSKYNVGKDRPFEKKVFNAGKKEFKPVCYKCGGKGHTASNCENGTKCFKCNKFGHISKDCRNKVKDEKTSTIQTVAVSEKQKIGENPMHKQVKVAAQRCVALFDTGSAVNIINSDVYEDLGKPQMEKSSIVLKGFDSKGKGVQPYGKINLDVTIDGEVFTLEFHVVKNECMSNVMVIGQPLCEQAQININANGVSVHKMEEVSIMQIAVNVENDDIEIGDEADEEAKKELQKIIRNYKPEKKKSTNVQMKITLVDETPIAIGPRRLPIVEKQIVDEQIEQWLKDGVVENSESEFSSPIVLVSKKDGGKRLCVDYRKINKLIVKDRFPLPLIEDQLDRLKDANWFSTIDLKNGFFHVPVEHESRKFTSFVTHSGQYQFCRVPFGLSNSPAVFQRHINAIFRDLTCKGIALPYVDDIIIPAMSEQEAVSNVKEVLKRCEEYGLNINWKKSQFLKREVEFVGHVIRNRTVAPSPRKKDVMTKYPIPRTLKQVESFLGLAGYFRKFIPEFANIAKPLSDLRKKDAKFIMGEAQINSFNLLKERLNEAPVLKIFHEAHETELHTDASAEGYGAALMQKAPEDNKMHPVYFMSKKTTDLEKKYTSYELEILAVVEALKKFRVYLLGIPFKVVTDCNAFATTMSKKDLPTRVSRWLMLLQEYNYVIEHRSGQQMRHVDALSRHAVMMIEEVEGVLTKIKRAQNEDEELQLIINLLKHQDEHQGFYMKSNILYKLDKGCELVVIPKLMEYEIIKKAHEKGHFSIQKTTKLLAGEYYIPKLVEKVQKCVNNCIECVLVNKKRGKQEGQLNPIPKEGIPLHTYHIDHLGPLESTSKMYKHIFAVIDSFTKFCWLYPTKSTTANEVVQKLQLQSGVFGNPRVIVSDRGSAFTSEEFTNYCQEEGIIHHLITTGLPRANGQIERLNSVIIGVLAKLSINDPTKWYRYVAKVQLIINSTHQRSIDATPFEILIGVKMRCKEDVQIKELIEEELKMSYDGMREELRVKAREHIAKVQDENRHTYNLRRKPATQYKVGDKVAIKRTQFGGGLKLKAKYLGPYIVSKVKPYNTYDVTKAAACEGPSKTTTTAEFMKKWPEVNEDTFGSQV